MAAAGMRQRHMGVRCSHLAKCSLGLRVVTPVGVHFPRQLAVQAPYAWQIVAHFGGQPEHLKLMLRLEHACHLRCSDPGMQLWAQRIEGGTR